MYEVKDEVQSCEAAEVYEIAAGSVRCNRIEALTKVFRVKQLADELNISIDIDGVEECYKYDARDECGDYDLCYELQY